MIYQCPICSREIKRSNDEVQHRSESDCTHFVGADKKEIVFMSSEWDGQHSPYMVIRGE